MDTQVASFLSTLMWAIFAGATLLSLSLGGLLAYHWFRYAMNRSMSVTMLLIYGGISFFLLSSLFAATIAVNSTL